MREIGKVSSSEHADRIVDYLLTQSIGSTAEPEDGVWVIWVREDDHRDRGKVIVQDFLSNPEDVRYRDAERQAKQLRKATVVESTKNSHRQVDVRGRWNRPRWLSSPVTQILMAICVLVVVVCTDWKQPDTGYGGLPGTCNDDQSVLRNALYITPPLTELEFAGVTFRMGKRLGALQVLKSGQIWRFVTPIFLHFSVLHILFNLMWLRTLGPSIESARGSGRFLLLVLLLAVVSNLTEYFWSGPGFGGMSGVVYGLIGYLWMKGRTEPQLGIGLSTDQIVYSVLFLFLCMGGVFGNIANGAHVGGLVLGLLIGSRKAVLRQLLGRN